MSHFVHIFQITGNMFFFFLFLFFPVSSFSVPKETYTKAGEGLLKRACSNRSGDNGFKQKESTFKLGLREKFFILSVMRHWKRLPREMPYNQKCSRPDWMMFRAGWSKKASTSDKGVETTWFLMSLSTKPVNDSVFINI